METNDLDEEHSIINLYNNKALHYCVKFNGKNINKVPVFKHWLNLMKLEKGEKGIIFYCTECHLFFFFKIIDKKIYILMIAHVMMLLNFAIIAENYIAITQYVALE